MASGKKLKVGGGDAVPRAADNRTYPSIFTFQTPSFPLTRTTTTIDLPAHTPTSINQTHTSTSPRPVLPSNHPPRAVHLPSVIPVPAPTPPIPTSTLPPRFHFGTGYRSWSLKAFKCAFKPLNEIPLPAGYRVTLPTPSTYMLVSYCSVLVFYILRLFLFLSPLECWGVCV